MGEIDVMAEVQSAFDALQADFVALKEKYDARGRDLTAEQQLHAETSLDLAKVTLERDRAEENHLKEAAAHDEARVGLAEATKQLADSQNFVQVQQTALRNKDQTIARLNYIYTGVQAEYGKACHERDELRTRLAKVAEAFAAVAGDLNK